jgi:hypothetical protein
MSEAGSSLPGGVAARTFRHLSPSIAPKRNYLAVDLTVSLLCASEKPRSFNLLEVPETIEWE